MSDKQREFSQLASHAAQRTRLSTTHYTQRPDSRSYNTRVASEGN